MRHLSLNLTNNKHVQKIANALVPKKKEEVKEEAVTKLPAPPVIGLEGEYSSHFRQGMIALVSTVALTAVWAGFVPLAGAVIVPGTFTVAVYPKKIAHKTGGTIKSIAVHDGSKVKTGDVLLTLDDTDTKAQNAAVARQIDETELRIARLTAERDNTKFVPPAKFLTPPDEHQKMVKAELDFYKARQQTQASIQKLANTRVAQLEKQIIGLGAQIHANRRQKDITNTELSGLETLRNKGFAPIQRLTPLQREKARLEGSTGQIEASIQEIQNKISEIKIQAQSSLDNFNADVIHDFSEAFAKIGQLLGQFMVTHQALQQMQIFAPVNGIVHELNVHTIGGIITPAETLMTIVPESEPLEITAKLPTDKIDQVRIGQPTRVRLPALTRTTPDIHGAINYISPDLQESKGGSYYELHITVEQKPFLTAGMPAECFLETEPRTLSSYLWRPIAEQMGRMFVER